MQLFTFTNMSLLSHSNRFLYYAIRLIVGVGCAFFGVAIASRIQLTLLGHPVPWTLQAQAWFVVFALQSRDLRIASVLSWLTAGALQLPVFAASTAGFWHLLGPTSGYLWSYLLVAYCFPAPYPYRPWRLLIVFFLANIVVLACGFAVLAVFLGMHQAWLLGVMPFLATDVIKTLVAWWLCCRSQRVARRYWDYLQLR